MSDNIDKIVAIMKQNMYTVILYGGGLVVLVPQYMCEWYLPYTQANCYVPIFILYGVVLEQ